MIKKEDTIGNTAQEALILLLAKSFDKYLKKQKVKKDFVDVLKKGREIFQDQLNIPYVEVWTLPIKKRKKIIISIVNKLIDCYNLQTMSAAIQKETLNIYKKWLKEFTNES